MKLIFIHGSGGSGEDWHYQTKYFQDSVAVDLPGHPEGEPCTSVDDYVEWLRGYIKERRFDDVVLAGHSLGGGIVLLYGLKYPDDLKALILVGSGARLRVHPDYLADCERGSADKASWIKNFIEPLFTLVLPEVREALIQKMVAIGPAVQHNDMLCCDRFDIMDKVHQIKLPTLALCGSQDVMTPVKYTQYLAAKIEGARQAIIEEGTHMVMAEKPEEVNRAIEEFLKSL